MAEQAARDRLTGGAGLDLGDEVRFVLLALADPLVTPGVWLFMARLLICAEEGGTRRRAALFRGGGGRAERRL